MHAVGFHSMSEKKKHQVMISSAWAGNLIMIALVVIILGAVVAYMEFSG